MTTQFSWRSYLDVADHLTRQRGEEFYRSAVSRAYYGVFGHVGDVLRRQGSVVSGGRDVHRQVINALTNDPRPGVSTLGEQLNYLRQERNRADYQANSQFDSSRAGNAVSIARGILNSVTILFP